MIYKSLIREHLMIGRLDKINSLVSKSPPLKSWATRGVGEVKARLDVELTARRTLSYLSGGDVIPLLREVDIGKRFKCKLWPNKLLLVFAIVSKKK